MGKFVSFLVKMIVYVLFENHKISKTKSLKLEIINS